jgi:phosphomethylpyrimidine synthase
LNLFRKVWLTARFVIPANVKHTNLVPCSIGKGLSTKVNANIGTSSDFGNIDTELQKMSIAIECQAHALMDLSTGGDIPGIRREIIKRCPLPVGTVPVYQACVTAAEREGAMVKMTADDLFEAIQSHIDDGVDFITVHCGITQASIARLKQQKRTADIVSRGGAFLTGWIIYHEQENPLYEQYDRLLEMVKKNDVTLSLGDGMRPGCLADATDRAQIEELITLGELVQRAQEAGVQVMVEGPGHVPLNQIETLQNPESTCAKRRLSMFGSLVIDVAAVVRPYPSAIGGRYRRLSRRRLPVLLLLPNICFTGCGV